VRNSITFGELVKSLAQRLGLDEEMIRTEFKRFKRKERGFLSRPEFLKMEESFKELYKEVQECNQEQLYFDAFKNLVGKIEAVTKEIEEAEFFLEYEVLVKEMSEKIRQIKKIINERDNVARLVEKADEMLGLVEKADERCNQLKSEKEDFMMEIGYCPMCERAFE
jgi:uncharacterized coiled-coil DUF342 family protein